MDTELTTTTAAMTNVDDGVPLASYGTSARGQRAPFTRTLKDLFADATAPACYLFAAIVASGTHFLLSAPPKAGKTWCALDAAVAVATGGVWLGLFPVCDPGPVIVISGEGAERNLLRRIRAIAASHGVTDPENLPISVRTIGMNLHHADDLTALAADVAAVKPRLVILDPLYLALGGTSMTSLSTVGELLHRLQLVTSAHGAALMVVHHDKKGGKSTDGDTGDRMSGAGPAAWGRTLLALADLGETTLPDGRTATVLRLDVQGDETAPATHHLARFVHADDLDDLDSDLTYHSVGLNPTELRIRRKTTRRTKTGAPAPTSAKDQILAVVQAASGALTVTGISDALTAAGTPCATRTIQARTKELILDGAITGPDSTSAGGAAKTYTAVGAPVSPPDNSARHQLAVTHSVGAA